MMLRSRLNRLEREMALPGNRCPACQGRPDVVLRFARQESIDADPVPYSLDDQRDTGEPCPACGWTPKVMEIVEVIIRNREELRRFQDAAGQWVV